jgi:hypothetical protein
MAKAWLLLREGCQAGCTKEKGLVLIPTPGPDKLVLAMGSKLTEYSG